VRPSTTGRAETLVAGLDAGMVPRVLLGAVSRVEIVAAGALQLTRDVLLTAVSGAASIGAEALTATADGTRGVVSAASRMVGDIATTAQGTFREALNNAMHARPGAARQALRRPPVAMVSRTEAASAALSAQAMQARRASRRGAAARQTGPTAAA
jgi:hypothetical protein